ncbi:ABC transporter permease [Bacillus fonticola]|uniref:ABC transporter permease n=1 Tax=Bacillus fonticola TaxID=2728853 RepID=UPI001473D906|nr:ABC transporter permease [Bacillus fonticola]
MNTIWQLTKLSMRALWRDRKTLLLAGLFPIICIGTITFLLWMLLSIDEQKPISVALVNQDKNFQTTFIVEHLQGLEHVQASLDIQEMSYEEGQEAIRTNDVAAMMVIPEGFAASLMDGENRSIEVVKNEEQPFYAEWISQFLHSTTDYVTAAQSAVNTLYHFQNKQNPALTVDEMQPAILAYTLQALKGQDFFDQEEEWRTDASSLLSYLIVSSWLLVLSMWSILSVVIVSLKSSHAVDERLQVMGVPRWKLLSSHWFGSIAFVMAWGIPYTVGMSLLWNESDVQLAPVLGTSIVLVVFWQAIAFLVCSISRNHLLQWVLLLPVFLCGTILGGQWVPVAYFPLEWMPILDLIPTTWFQQWGLFAWGEGGEKLQVQVMILFLIGMILLVFAVECSRRGFISGQGVNENPKTHRIENKVAVFIVLAVIPVIATQGWAWGTREAGENVRIPIAIVTEEETEMVESVLKRLEETTQTYRLIQLEEDEARRALAIGKVDSVFLFQKGFEERLVNGEIDPIVTSIIGAGSFGYGVFQEELASELMRIALQAKAAVSLEAMEAVTYEEAYAFGQQYWEPVPLLTVAESTMEANDEKGSEEVVSPFSWGVWMLSASLLLIERSGKLQVLRTTPLGKRIRTTAKGWKAYASKQHFLWGTGLFVGGLLLELIASPTPFMSGMLAFKLALVSLFLVSFWGSMATFFRGKNSFVLFASLLALFMSLLGGAFVGGSELLRTVTFAEEILPFGVFQTWLLQSPFLYTPALLWVGFGIFACWGNHYREENRS